MRIRAQVLDQSPVILQRMKDVQDYNFFAIKDVNHEIFIYRGIIYRGNSAFYRLNFWQSGDAINLGNSGNYFFLMLQFVKEVIFCLR